LIVVEYSVINSIKNINQW